MGMKGQTNTRESPEGPSRPEERTEELLAFWNPRYKGDRGAGILYQPPLGPRSRYQLWASGSPIHCLTPFNHEAIESDSSGPNIGKCKPHMQTTYLLGEGPRGLCLLIASTAVGPGKN